MTKNFINGKFVESAATEFYDVHNPVCIDACTDSCVWLAYDCAEISSKWLV